ncbi:hypothetical protein ES705_41741 [subsurface metagenome]
MADKKAKKRRHLVTADSVDQEALELALQSQGNAIPAAVATVIRLVAPILARLAIRYVSRKLHRHVSEGTVRAGGAWAGLMVNTILKRSGIVSQT